MPPKDVVVVDWELLAVTSPLAVALQVRELLPDGDSTNAIRGLVLLR